MYANAQGAPLLCAGLIGYRSYNMIDKNAEHIGIYGFGAAAHILTQAAITRKDGDDFLKLAADANIKTQTKLFQLHKANKALKELREGKFSGAAVLIMP